MPAAWWASRPIVRDIGERKARERHIEFLMRELSHRSKNLLAVVQAIAGQTARHSPDLKEFQARFSQRVQALARSQDLLVGRDWKGADAGRRWCARSWRRSRTRWPRASISADPRSSCGPDAVHSLTLAVHELATNAAKYGALSVPEGRVAIAWTLDGTRGSGRRFRMSWRETGGPPVSPPTRKGFGHVVISEIVASSMGGEVTLEYAPEGVRWTLDLPNANVTAADPTP